VVFTANGPALSFEPPAEPSVFGSLLERIGFELTIDDGCVVTKEPIDFEVEYSPVDLVGIVINEVLPGATASRVELYNIGQMPWNITGATIAGYRIGSDPARETYVSSTTGGTASPSDFHPGAYVVINFPANLAHASLELLALGLIPVDAVQVDNSCIPGAGDPAKPSLSRNFGPNIGDDCNEWQWSASPTLGAFNRF
jgi:hypothetical protein